MKTWLSKWKISNALDNRKPLSPAMECAVAESEELRSFAERSAELDRALKNSRRDFETSMELHAGIMRAARAAEPDAVSSRQTFWPRLIPATALVLLVFFGVFAANHFFRERATVSKRIDMSSLADASSAIELSGKLASELPDAALSPLNDEGLRLKYDLANAKKFLLASLP